MRIGISSWSYPYAIGNQAYEIPKKPMDVAKLLDMAVLHGVEVLQIADNLPLNSVADSYLDNVRLIAKVHGLSIEIGTVGLDRDNLLKYLQLAQRLGAGLVRTLPHSGNEFPTIEQAKCKVRDVLPQYEAAGIMLGIENHDHYPIQWIRELVDFAASPILGVCLDAVNNLGLGESFRETINLLGPVTVSFHCKDYTIHRKPSMLGFDVVGAVAGEGFLDMDLAWKMLPRGISWILESWLPWQGTLAATLTLEEAWVVQGLNNLRAFRDRHGV